MKSLSKLSSALAATVALNACTPSQPAEAPQKAATEIRTNVGEALAQIGTDRQGIQAGPNPNTVSSVVCGEGLLEDKTELDVSIEARRQLQNFACPGDPDAYVPTYNQRKGVSGSTVCMSITAPRTIVCNGQTITLEEAK